MRKVLCILSLAYLISCSKYEQTNYQAGEMKIFASTCKVDIEKAEKDINNNILVYPYYLGMFKEYNGKEELDSLLLKYNIRTDTVVTDCITPSEVQNCYYKRMVREIKSKYGDNFLDSLKNIAEIKYVHNNINKIFRFEDCDTITRYPNAKNYKEHFNNQKRDFFLNFSYPKGYQFRKEGDYYSYTSAYCILYKNGEISDLEIDTKFQNRENDKYENYFNQKVREFILKTNWKPATKKGIVVNSELPVTIHYR